MATDRALDRLVASIFATLQSSNCADSNGEIANVVDGLYAIADGLSRIASVMENREARDEAEPPEVVVALDRIGEEIRQLRESKDDSHG